MIDGDSEGVVQGFQRPSFFIDSGGACLLLQCLKNDIGRFRRTKIIVEINVAQSRRHRKGCALESHSNQSASPFRTTLAADLATHSHRPTQTAVRHQDCIGEGVVDRISSHEQKTLDTDVLMLRVYQKGAYCGQMNGRAMWESVLVIRLYLRSQSEVVTRVQLQAHFLPAPPSTNLLAPSAQAHPRHPMSLCTIQHLLSLGCHRLAIRLYPIPLPWYGTGEVAVPPRYCS